jgi:hypothetical protein
MFIFFFDSVIQSLSNFLRSIFVDLVRTRQIYAKFSQKHAVLLIQCNRVAFYLLLHDI